MTIHLHCRVGARLCYLGTIELREFDPDLALVAARARSAHMHAVAWEASTRRRKLADPSSRRPTERYSPEARHAVDARQVREWRGFEDRSYRKGDTQ